MVNYDGKRFRPAVTSENGEVDEATIFEYKQTGNLVTCEYKGTHVIKGHLIGVVNEEGIIDIRYHQVNAKGELTTGICHSTPEQLSNGKLRIHEKWQWTSGDQSKGESVLEEV